MIAATHLAIGISCGIMFGLPGTSVVLLGAGSLLPDLDTPKSMVGRLFLPFSLPISSWLGHRGAFHAFWLWGAITALGWLWYPFFYLGLGGLIHVVSDCATVSGVRAMTPFSSKLFVFFQRSWRFKTGGRGEFALLFVFGTLAWAGHSVTTMGGITAILGHITGAPKIAMEEYISKGLEICRVEGKFRWNSGYTEEMNWLVVGMEGSSKLVMENSGKLIRDGVDGKLLRARLQPSKIFWKEAKVKGWYKVKNRSFYFSDRKWAAAKPGGVVWGTVISERIELLDPFEDEKETAFLDRFNASQYIGE